MMLNALGPNEAGLGTVRRADLSIKRSVLTIPPMKKLSLSFGLLFAVLLGGIRVGHADSMPVEGTRELRLGSSMGILSMYGPGINVLSSEHGSDMKLVSIGAGMGYFASDNVEVGGSVGYFYLSSGSGTQGPGLSGFVRVYKKTGNVGLFFEPTLEFQYLKGSGFSEKILGPGADLGIEIFLADSWALRLSPGLRYYKAWASSSSGGGSGSSSITKFGLNWGISAYF
jgi:hypothetical protein